MTFYHDFDFQAFSNKTKRNFEKKFLKKRQFRVFEMPLFKVFEDFELVGVERLGLLDGGHRLTGVETSAPLVVREQAFEAVLEQTKVSSSEVMTRQTD